MAPPRGLSVEEAAIWAQLAESVTPLEGRVRPPMPKAATVPVAAPPKQPVRAKRKVAPAKSAPPITVPVRKIGEAGLDSHWDRRLKTGAIVPDFTLDLHGHGLDAAHDRLMSGIAQARAMGARVVLLIAGKSRPVDPADRGTKRGAIRSKVLDWLAASSHGSAISAIRKAHRHHGGDGALYIVLKRNR